MCYQQIAIKNNCRSYYPSKDVFQFSVPCGHCADCDTTRQQEWFVRCFFHWQYIKENGGQAYFYTLTFNDSHLPHYDGIPCFDLKLVQQFTKLLKVRLKRHLKVKCQYLITCEYGELFKRPHLHGAFFIDKSVFPVSFLKEIQDAWPHGFVCAGDNLGLIDSPSGLQYVTKYITKDSSFTELDGKLVFRISEKYSELFNSKIASGELIPTSTISTFNDLLMSHDDLAPGDPLKLFYNEYKAACRRYTAFNSHSTYLGSCLIDMPKYLDKLKKSVLMPHGEGFKPIPMPRYIQRKIYYTRVPNDKDGKLTRFVLNDFGRDVNLHQLPDKIFKLSLDLQGFFRNCPITDFQFELASKFFLYDFEGAKNFRSFCRSVDVDFEKLAIYALVYRNRVVPPDFDFSSAFVNYLSYMRDILSRQDSCLLPPLSSYSGDEVRLLSSHLFNNHPNFFIYENLMLIYDSCSRLLKKEAAFKRMQDYALQRKIRQVIKKQKQLFLYGT